jgi:type III secretory pathway component EscU
VTKWTLLRAANQLLGVPTDINFTPSTCDYFHYCKEIISNASLLETFKSLSKVLMLSRAVMEVSVTENKIAAVNENLVQALGPCPTKST